MATEVLDIVVRQRGAKVVARDIERIGIAATSTSRSVSALQRSLTTAQGSLRRVQATTQAATTNQPESPALASDEFVMASLPVSIP